MISKAERQHLVELRKWSAEARAGLQDLMRAPIFKMLNHGDPTVVFDNVDWLIALIERESHTAGVKGILKAVEEHAGSVPADGLCPHGSRWRDPCVMCGRTAVTERKIGSAR